MKQKTCTTYTILLHLTIAAKGLQLLAQLLEYLLRLLGHGKIEEDNLFKGAHQKNNHKQQQSEKRGKKVNKTAAGWGRSQKTLR